ncbi:MAG: heme peroxidase, partial [Actinomycetota bacterium]|nr:heme peroxidase [Actinomycetota bacterium]
MERHGAESYFVLGEGLLTEALDGRTRTLGSAAETAVPPFRFSRLGPSGAGQQLGDAVRRKVGNAM